MTRILAAALVALFLAPANSEAEDKDGTPDFELDLLHVDGGYIQGKYETNNGVKKFEFRHDGYFSYTREKDRNKEDGAYERSSCAIASTNTGEVLHQGNFKFYWNNTSCCYYVRLIGNKLLVLDRVWAKGSPTGGRASGFRSAANRKCPNLNLRFLGEH